MPDISRDDVDTLQASCREIAAKGGETGEIARRILAVSKEISESIALADEFLSRHRK